MADKLRKFKSMGEEDKLERRLNNKSRGQYEARFFSERMSVEQLQELVNAENVK